MGKETYKPTPEDEEAAQAMLTPGTAFESETRSETLTGNRVALDHERAVIFEGGKIFIEEGREYGKEAKHKTEQTPTEAIKGLEWEEQGINDKIRELQQKLEEIATLKERILRMQAEEIK